MTSRNPELPLFLKYKLLIQLNYRQCRTLVPLQFKQLCTRMPSPSADDSEETKARILEEQEERAKKQELRSSLVIGLNQVTRALEQGTLKLVLVR